MVGDAKLLISRSGRSSEKGKFLPLKTPLDSKFDNNVPEANRWNLEMLFAYIKAQKSKIGLFVDLTNTDRFYDSAQLHQFNCKYLKLQCRGHGETPNEDQTRTFVDICRQFFGQNGNEIVAVHCTHGFNRTGFLICAYLVEQLGWDLEYSVMVFSQARPPGIYKQDYLNELARLYDDESSGPVAPALPDWCFEKGNVIAETDDHTNAATSAAKRRRTSSNDLSPDADSQTPRRPKVGVFAVPGLDGVYPVSDSNVLRKIQSRCRELLNWKRDEFPGQQPVSMDRDNMNFLTKKPYLVSWKADGTRYLMLIDGARETYMVDRDNCVFHLPNFRFPSRKKATDSLHSTLVDGEVVVDQLPDSSKKLVNYLMYDIVRFNGVNVCDCHFSRRQLCINREIIEVRRAVLTPEQRAAEPFRICAKPFWDIKSAAKLLAGKFRDQVTHEIDGLIFQPALEAYTGGRCDTVLKWKPPELNTIDFLLKISVIPMKEGTLPEKIGYLYVGGLDTPFSSMKVTKELRALDGQIIECRWDAKTQQYQYLKQRTDKSFPNGYRTAMGVVKSISNPVTRDTLLALIDKVDLSKLETPDERAGRPTAPAAADHRFAVPNPPAFRPAAASTADDSATSDMP